MSKGVMYVDNIRVEYDNEPNVLEVCRKAGVEIPNFCFHSDLSVYGACRMCMVEEEGTGKIDAACTMPPKNELHIRTNTARLLKYRRMIIELLLSAHCRDCTTCEKNRACRLQEMAVRFGIHHVRFDDTREHVKMDWAKVEMTRRLPCPLRLLNERSCPVTRRGVPSAMSMPSSRAEGARMRGRSLCPDRRSTRSGQR